MSGTTINISGSNNDSNLVLTSPNATITDNATSSDLSTNSVPTRETTIAKALKGKEVTVSAYYWNDMMQSFDGLSAIKSGTDGTRTSHREGLENDLVKCVEHVLYGQGDKILYKDRHSNTRIEGVYNTIPNATIDIAGKENVVGVYDFLLAGTSITLKRAIEQKALYSRPYIYSGQRIVMNSDSFDFSELNGNFSKSSPPTFKEYIDALYNATISPTNTVDKKYRFCTCSVNTTCDVDVVNFIKKHYPNITDEQIYGIVTPGVNTSTNQYLAEESDNYTRRGMVRRISDFTMCFNNTVDGSCCGTLRDTTAFYGFFNTTDASHVVSVKIDNDPGSSKNLNNDDYGAVFRQEDYDTCNLFNLIITTLLTAYKIGLGKGSTLQDLESLQGKVPAQDFDLLKNGTPYVSFGLPGKRAFEIVQTFGNMREITEAAQATFESKVPADTGNINLWSSRNQLAHGVGLSSTNTDNEKGCYTLALYGYSV